MIAFLKRYFFVPVEKGLVLVIISHEMVCVCVYIYI